MIDRDTALGHHLFKITQTERVGDVLPHAQQHHIERIVQALQHPGNARCKALSQRLRLLHGQPPGARVPGFAQRLISSSRGGMRIGGERQRSEGSRERPEPGWQYVVVDSTGQILEIQVTVQASDKHLAHP